MDAVNNDFLGKHKKFRTDSKKLAITFFVAAVTVAIIVFWWLKLTGITVTGDAFCGLSEHTHGDDCYVNELVCDIESSSDETVTDGTVEHHIHTDECFVQTLSCTKNEHIHTAECFPDTSADIETVSDWISTIENVEITNDIPENLIAIALSQMGYEESQLNFEYDADGNKNGYTRYGEWYGNPYGKWNTMFVSFCIHYSNINNDSELKSAGAESMRLLWQQRNAWSEASAYAPARGDIVFFDNDTDGAADATGIILSVSPAGLVVVCGDSNNRVETCSVEISDNILGYGLSGELYFARDTEYTENDDAAEEEPAEDGEYIPLMLMSEDSGGPNIQYLTDLSKFLVDVDFSTTDGVEITDGDTVYIGQTYVITMEFREQNEGDEWLQFGHNDEHFLTYQIPGNFHCEPFTEWHHITAITENGTVEDVGLYFIDENGHLLVTFYDGDDGLCFGHRYSNVDFVIEFNASVGATQSGTSSEVVFNEEIKININIDGGAGMTVSKDHGSYDSQTNTMEYIIEVKATYGVVKDLVLDDQVWDTHHTLRDTIVVTDLDGNVLDPQPVVSNHPAHNSGADEGFRISGFPDFAAGEGYLITYKSQVYDDMLLNDSVGLWNGLDANANATNGDPLYQWTEDWVQVELDKLTKNGKQKLITIGGEELPVIEWEVVIKQNESNLHGTVIIDTLGEGLEYYTGSDILIKRYDAWGNALSDVRINWNNVTIDGDSMSFTLPEGYVFDIYYYTTYEQPAEGEVRNYRNTVKAEINNKFEISDGSADVVAFVPRVGKSASGTDGEYVYFNIDADVPAVIRNWGNFLFTDLCAFWGYANDVGVLYVENSPEELVITAETVSGDIITFTPYVPGGPIENTYILVYPATGDLHHSFNIYFNTSDPERSNSKWILDEDAVLRISYKLPFDAATGIEWIGELSGDKTLGDVLIEGYTLANEAYLDYTDVISASGSATYRYSPKITKNSYLVNDGVIDYKVVFYNTIPGAAGTGYLTSTTENFRFTDTFDEKLEYVDGSLIVTCYSPWQDGLWLNKYIYEGSVEGNSMEIYASQFRFLETNPEAAAVGWSNLSVYPDLEAYYKNMSSWGNGGGRFVFNYTLKVKNEYLFTTEESRYVLDNTAEILWGTDGTTGPAFETTEFRTGLMDKHVIQKNDKLDFDIHINKNALDILPGTDTIIIEDTMTPILSVYWDTIKLFYEDENGEWIDFHSENSVYEYSVTYDQPTNKLTFTLPDELHIRIDYTTLITESGLVSVYNAVHIDGKAQVTDIVDAVFTVQQHSGGATGSIHNITLLKHDGLTGEPLSDVIFHFYGPMGTPGAVVPSGASATITTETGKVLYYIGSYTTTADGTVNIETQYLTVGGPYGLVEENTPDGYINLGKPVYFYFFKEDPNGIIQTATTIVTVENYTYGFVFPETGGTGTLPLTIIGSVLMTAPILYSIIRRKRERRLSQSP